MVQPILTYGSENWGIDKKSCKTIDNLFNWFIRLVLKVKPTTCNIITWGECGIIPPSVYCHINVILYAITIQYNTIRFIFRRIVTNNKH